MLKQIYARFSYFLPRQCGYPLLILLTVSIGFQQCSETTEIAGSNAGQVTPPIHEGQKIYIQDRTGKRWDVTHAQKKYGLLAQNFQFGLGPFAIRPINNPEMCKPGDPGYPSFNNEEQVIGVQIGTDIHAYPLSLLRSFEVVNTIIGDEHVSPAY